MPLFRNQTGRWLGPLLAGALAVAAVWLAWDKLAWSPGAGLEAIPEPGAGKRQGVYLGPRNSIAVLPFDDLSPDQDQAWLSDGIALDLLNMLTGVRELQVTARTSAFFFRGEDLSVPIVAERLKVRHLLAGGAALSGERIRITARLIEARADSELWEETFDRAPDEVFAVQEEIAAAVLRTMAVTPSGEAPMGARIDTEAWNQYLRGRYHLYRRDGGDGAEAGFKRALEIEPGFAPARVGLARLYLQQGAAAAAGVPGYELARAEAQAAIDLDSQNAEAYSLLGAIRREYDWDWQAAGQAALRALELDPGNAAVLSLAGNHHFTFGEFETAIELTQEAISRDPLLLQTQLRLGLLYEFAGRYDEALFTYRQLLALNSGYPGVHAYRARAKIAQGKAESALKAADEEQDPFWSRYAAILALSALDRLEEADPLLQDMIGDNAHDAAFQIAEIYAFRGETDAAFEWLQRAYAQRDGGMTEILGNYFLLNLEEDPRWAEMLQRLNLPRDFRFAAE